MTFQSDKTELRLYGVVEGRRYAIVITGDDAALTANPPAIKFRHAGDPKYRTLPGFDSATNGDGVVANEVLAPSPDMVLTFDSSPGPYYVSVVSFTTSEF